MYKISAIFLLFSPPHQILNSYHLLSNNKKSKVRTSYAIFDKQEKKVKGKFCVFHYSDVFHVRTKQLNYHVQIQYD